MDTQSSRIDEEVASQTPEKDALTYEETPPIVPVKGPQPDIFSPPKPQNKAASIITTIVFFVILFIVGFWLSGFVRQYAGTFLKGGNGEKVVATPTPKTTAANLIPTIAEDPTALWKTYQVINGKTKMIYEGTTFKLPPDNLAPICDGSTCRSQGTYLPGSTRFTVALRGEGQVLPDFRGKIISDLNGIPLTVAETVLVGGHSATEFTGSFIGTTVAGFVFSQMHGYMIPITDTISLEINHFSPRGITTDFAKDDALFDQIVETLVLPVNVSEKGAMSTSSSAILTVTPTPTTLLLQSSPSATPMIEE